jgi:hypothetical protein
MRRAAALQSSSTASRPKKTAQPAHDIRVPLINFSDPQQLIFDEFLIRRGERRVRHSGAMREGPARGREGACAQSRMIAEHVTTQCAVVGGLRQKVQGSREACVPPARVDGCVPARQNGDRAMLLHVFEQSRCHDDVALYSVVGSDS